MSGCPPAGHRAPRRARHRAAHRRRPAASAGAAAGMLAGVDVAALAQRAGVSPTAAPGRAGLRQRRPLARGRTGRRFDARGRHCRRGGRRDAEPGRGQRRIAPSGSSTARSTRPTTAATPTCSAWSQRMQAGEVGALLVHGPNPLYNMPEHDAVEAALDACRSSRRSRHARRDQCEGAPAAARPPLPRELGRLRAAHRRDRARAAGHDARLPDQADRRRAAVGRAAAERPAADAGEHVLRLPARALVETIMPGSGSDRLVRGRVARGAAGRLRAEHRAGRTGRRAATPDGAAACWPAWPSWRPRSPARPATTRSTSSSYPSLRFFDGRLANRPWLQELPDPDQQVLLVSWVEINPATADHHGLDNGHIVEVRLHAGPMSLPAWRHPGTRRTRSRSRSGRATRHLGRYARDRGVNAMRLLEPAAEPLSGALVMRRRVRASIPTGKWERPIQAGLQTPGRTARSRAPRR
jgi:anaerobic selenocysteine-containing dehydrogenase